MEELAPDPQTLSTPAFVTIDAFEQFKAQMLQAMTDLLPQVSPEGKGKAKVAPQGDNEDISLNLSKVGEESSKNVSQTRTVTHLRARSQHAATSLSSGQNTIALMDTFKPFRRHILEEEISDKLKPLALQYDGTSDPQDHLTAFADKMNFQNAADSALCKAFPLTLKGNACTWFSKLPQNSVSSFEDLNRKFLRYFSVSKKP
ncbi:hypothetical protein L2V44_14150, partial [Staphylococcus aureus]|nr:hypothetical protein [Staphylococcus aureus]